MSKKDFETMKKELLEESKIDSLIQFTSYTVAAMSGALVEILKEKGVINDQDMERIQKVGIEAGEALRKSYESIGKNPESGFNLKKTGDFGGSGVS